MANQSREVGKPRIRIVGAGYLDEMRRDYALYVMQSRAVVSESDGLKPSGRRALWVARDGHAIKTANLAGACAPLHPHASPEGAINTLAGFFINNVPLFQGFGTFGTRNEPHAFGAARYTEVKLSRFTKDVLMVDREIVPMKPNYDGTLQEPVHFLPLVPISLLNPSEGIAVGFSCNVLPRRLDAVVANQISYLQGKRYKEATPELTAINSAAIEQVDGRWIFHGTIERTAHNQVTITSVPYGTTYDSVIDKLKEMEAADKFVTFDDMSTDTLKIVVTYKKGELKNYTDEELLKAYGLITRQTESMIMVAFDGVHAVEHTYRTAMEAFCDWRLEWYVARYKHLKGVLEKDLQYSSDIIIAIKSGIVGRLTKIKSKAVLEADLGKAGVVNTTAIAALPSYRFTEEEVAKQEAEVKRLQGELKNCNQMLKDPELRRAQYIAELQEIQTAYKKGVYDTIM
jgi:DNA gyrase/topoisomerase IV subunit A